MAFLLRPDGSPDETAKTLIGEFSLFFADCETDPLHYFVALRLDYVRLIGPPPPLSESFQEFHLALDPPPEKTVDLDGQDFWAILQMLVEEGGDNTSPLLFTHLPTSEQHAAIATRAPPEHSLTTRFRFGRTYFLCCKRTESQAIDHILPWSLLGNMPFINYKIWIWGGCRATGEIRNLSDFSDVEPIQASFSRLMPTQFGDLTLRCSGVNQIQRIDYPLNYRRSPTRLCFKTLPRSTPTTLRTYWVAMDGSRFLDRTAAGVFGVSPGPDGVAGSLLIIAGCYLTQGSSTCASVFSGDQSWELEDGAEDGEYRLLGPRASYLIRLRYRFGSPLSHRWFVPYFPIDRSRDYRAFFNGHE